MYGYRIPNLDKALYSEDSRVVFLKSNQIRIKKVHVYEIYIPEDFFIGNTEKKISVTLVYDPPIKRNRVDYIGCQLEFSLFKNTNFEVIQEAFIENSEGVELPKKLKKQEIELKPGKNLRNKCVHQKGIKIYKRRPEFNPSKPLFLVVSCISKWKEFDELLQDYSIVLSIENRQSVNLYQKVSIRNRVRVEIRPRY